MCGIAGYLSNEIFSENVIIEMSKKISHRGPDATGYWSDVEKGIHFCHLRLSIIDLTSAGAQPMESRSGRYVVVFNGEIYNFLEIKKSIEEECGAYEWRGYSDTEIFLAGFEHWGIEVTVKKMIGMFAIALWDKQTNELYLIRDRVGEKPLYFGWQKNAFLFASELKALSVHPAFKKEIDVTAVASFFKYNYIPAPLSIYSGINKLKPGSYCKVSLLNFEIKYFDYWALDSIIKENQEQRLEKKLDIKNQINSLDTLLKDAINKQMLSDVPLGAFLSGGVDSSTVVALMQSQSAKAVKTFSIGFDEKNFDEAIYAKKVSRHLGTEHTELYVTSEDALNVIPKLPAIYDEPFSDSSQIPTYLVAKLAREKVTVSLSGDAGDELFSGYDRYTLAQNVWNKLSILPVSLRKELSNLITGLNPDRVNSFYNKFKFAFPKKYQVQNFSDKLRKGAVLFERTSPEKLYDGFISHWDPSKIVTNYNHHTKYSFMEMSSLNFNEQMMRLDTLTYLPDDILVKVDRAAMSNSLETRVPFLDHRVIEFAWGLPMDLKIRNGVSKWILKEVLYKYVPKELIERPKMGFAVPVNIWLRGPLKEWAENLLSKSALDKHGLLNYDEVKKNWDEHQSEERNWQYYLWDILMFQAWYEEYHING